MSTNFGSRDVLSRHGLLEQQALPQQGSTGKSANNWHPRGVKLLAPFWEGLQSYVNTNHNHMPRAGAKLKCALLPCQSASSQEGVALTWHWRCGLKAHGQGNGLCLQSLLLLGSAILVLHRCPSGSHCQVTSQLSPVTRPHSPGAASPP